LPSPEEKFAEEERRVRYLARLADVVCALISQGNLTLLDSFRLMQIARAEATRLFPDKAAVYDLVYQPRFARLVAQHVLSALAWIN